MNAAEMSNTSVGGDAVNTTSDGGGEQHSERWWIMFLGSFVLCTLFGNALVVASVVRMKYLRSVTNYFIVSLAVADIAVGALVMPLAVYVEVMDGVFALPETLCDAWIAADVMACTASILNLVAISIDRFMAITRPLKYQQSIKNSRIYTAATIAACWMLSIAIALPLALGANYTSYRVAGACTFFNPLFIIFSSMGSFFIPSFVMIILYWKIFKVIRERATVAKERNRGRKQALDGGSGGGGGGGGGVGGGGAGDGGGQKNIYSEVAAAVKDVGTVNDTRGDRGGEYGASSYSPARAAACDNADELDESAASEDVWIRQSSTNSSNKVLPDVKASRMPLLSTTNGSSNGAPVTKKTRASRKASGEARKKDKKERKATVTLVVVLGVFLFCWIPFFVTNNLSAVCLQLGSGASVCAIPPRLVSFFIWLGYCNSTVNPLIYAVLNNDFRRAFLKLLHLGSKKAKGNRHRIKT